VDISAPNKNIWIYYEFKSVAKVPPAHFAEQFLKDLTNKDVTSLDQIKWIFDGKKNPANFKTNMLHAIDNLLLTDDLAKKFIPNNPNANINKLKDLLEVKFDQIFKLSN